MTDDQRAKHVTVDGLEGEYARVELPDGTTEDWLLRDLPDGVREGDVLTVRAGDEGFELELDHEQTKQRRAHAQTQLDALNSAAPSGEIDL